MNAEVIDRMDALRGLMDEETQALDALADNRRLAELTRVKLRLVGQLEQAMARRSRLREAMSDEERQSLAAALDRLVRTGRENGAALTRQIELTGDLLDTLVAAARRVGGRRAATYGAAGDLAVPDAALPIAFNARF